MMPPANLYRIIVRAGAERNGVGTLAVALRGIRHAHTASLIVERIPHDE